MMVDNQLKLNCTHLTVCFNLSTKINATKTEHYLKRNLQLSNLFKSKKQLLY